MEESGLERVGDGEKEENRDGRRSGKRGDERLSSKMLEVEGGSELLELFMVFDIFRYSRIIATCDDETNPLALFLGDFSEGLDSKGDVFFFSRNG